jgi:hypothetical protein
MPLVATITPVLAFGPTNSLPNSPGAVTPVAIAVPPPTPTTGLIKPSIGTSSITETLQMLVGIGNLPSSDELAAKLQAATPDVYED